MLSADITVATLVEDGVVRGDLVARGGVISVVPEQAEFPSIVCCAGGWLCWWVVLLVGGCWKEVDVVGMWRGGRSG